ncbi:MAG: helix-turn-helix domain-containing protein [Cetobacterium sp.]
MLNKEKKIKALEMLEQKMKYQDIANTLGVSLRTVKNWVKEKKDGKEQFEYINAKTGEILLVTKHLKYIEQLYHYISNEKGDEFGRSYFARIFGCSEYSIPVWSKKTPLYQLVNIEQLELDYHKFLEGNGHSLNKKGNVSSKRFCGTYWKNKSSVIILKRLEKLLIDYEKYNQTIQLRLIELKKKNKEDMKLYYILNYYFSCAKALYKYCKEFGIVSPTLEVLPDFIYYKTSYFQELPENLKNHVVEQVINGNVAIYLNENIEKIYNDIEKKLIEEYEDAAELKVF